MYALFLDLSIARPLGGTHPGYSPRHAGSKPCQALRQDTLAPILPQCADPRPVLRESQFSVLICRCQQCFLPRLRT